ncbi:MAG: thioredoxin domain-containing protein [Anaerolineales bacterium]|nr:thioredoxin domain-containing protein [Anaerolineales bacterium]
MDDSKSIDEKDQKNVISVEESTEAVEESTEAVEESTEAVEESTEAVEKKKKPWITTSVLKSIFIVVVVFALGVGSGYLIRGTATPKESADLAKYQFDYIEGAPVKGNDDAPITIVEFSDFECVYCANYANSTYTQIEEVYGDQLKYVYISFPLISIHPNAAAASLASMCAQEQNAFWDYYKLLFSGRDGLSREAYMTYAEELGLDKTSFSECLDENRYLDTLDENFYRAQVFGINSTPTFLVNGVMIKGAQPFEVFSNIIESELGTK